MLYDNALLVPAYLHAWVVTGEERYRAVVEETCDYLLRDLRAARGRLRLVAGRRHRRRRGADLHVDGGRGRPGRAAAPVRARPLDHPRRARRRSCGRACSRSARTARSPAATTRRSPRGTGWPSPPSRRPGVACQVTACYKRPSELGNFLLSELSAPDGRLFRTWRNGQASIPGFLEDYADVAHGLYELHVATGELRWLEEANRLARLAVDLFADDAPRRLLHDRPRRRGARRPQEGPGRQPRPVGELDARVRAAPAGADLRRRRARASRRRRPPAAAHEHEPDPVGVRLGAVRARPVPLAAAGARDHRLAGGRGRARRAGAVRPEHGRRVRPGRTSRSSRARRASTGSRRSTCASGSPAGRR